ncbi:DUF3141 domain-containing protein [Siccirubricoccus phaeus]|uniref:DUF3141 domain-containing protein n=1 Tax=Siccirubricoccus phaeus TaxID=2595053 RepID=UPI001F306296|nr:DUF3141 domain-containing protein [Siccirubricoccus phaeus]
MDGTVAAAEDATGSPEVASRGQRRHERAVGDGTPVASVGMAGASLPGPALPWVDLLEYQRDFWERSILFWDTLRQRADGTLEHERLGLPPLLDFRSETVLDARTLPRPANYALLRILGPADGARVLAPDPAKPPVIVVDPRAGHGPGIGGFKQDSEVGMALGEGHPVYFVVFFPEPCRGQTLADVHHALRRFVETVAERHPGKPPVLYGNCQAGWAVALLSADCCGLVGAAVLNGSPLSYWGGESGVNPMRLAGGLLGGAWLAELAADLGGGRLDGAWLAANFENLKPERAIWEKYARLFAEVDTERERFLRFERWWGGFHSLGREEMAAIVENLFIGNQVEQGVFRICEGCVADLRRVRNPLVVFASEGDDITPPHQALGWIPAVYGSTEALKAAGQRIVYLINPHVGHLGIFVSAAVARREHRAILASLADIEALPPGLYEMRIEDTPDGGARPPAGRAAVRFEPRAVEDLRFAPPPREAFERVRAVSETGLALYRSFLKPWVQATSNPWTVGLLRWLHPMRTSRYLLSEEFQPWMRLVAAAAAQVEANRHRTRPDNPLLSQERAIVGVVSQAVEAARAFRDAAAERGFSTLYSGPIGTARSASGGDAGG